MPYKIHFMKKALLIILCIAGITASTNAQIPVAFTNHLQYMLDSLCDKYHIKGVSAAVLVPGMGTWKGTHGVSHGNVPLTTDMYLPIGSNTKTFTASIMLKLQENGQLSLDDTIGKWLPNIPNVNGQITIRQMLNHTSGLFNYTNHPGFFTALNADYTHLYQPEDMLQFIDTPDFAPGTSWAYSNTNYLLAGLIIKQILNEPYHVTVRNRIFTPQGFNHSVTIPQETPTGIIPHGWSEGNGKLEDMQLTYNWDHTAFMSMAGAAGAITSTAEDNVKFWDALMTGKIINSNSLSQMTTTIPVSNGVGYGLGTFRYSGVNGRVVYCHGGTCFGYINENLRDSVSGVCITALSNQDSVYNNLLFNWVVVPLHKYILKFPPAGVQYVNTTPEIHMYPNPATDAVQLQGIEKPMQFTIYDITGKQVLTRETNKGNTSVSLTGVQQGLYIARITDNGQAVYTGRLQVIK